MIADDHPIVRHGLERAIMQQDEHVTFVHASNGAEALTLLNEQSIDISFLDINMPLMDGLEVVERYKQQHSDATRFVIFTLHKDIYYFSKGKELGFSGYLLKEFALDEICFCIQEIMNDRCFVSNALFAELSKTKEVQQTLQNLSLPERRILALIKEGKSTKEISDSLMISSKSISQLKGKICQKINIPKDESSLLNWTYENKGALSFG